MVILPLEEAEVGTPGYAEVLAENGQFNMPSRASHSKQTFIVDVTERMRPCRKGI